MRKIRVFKTNQNNKIDFTERELENLLNEVFQEGYQEGSKIVPGVLPSYPVYRSNEISCLNSGSENISQPKTVFAKLNEELNR